MTMSGEVSQPGVQPGAEAPAPANKALNKKEAKAQKAKASGGDSVLAAQTPPAAAPAAPKSAEERLKELNGLKKDGLIDKTEYETQKKEILKDL